MRKPGAICRRAESPCRDVRLTWLFLAQVILANLCRACCLDYLTRHVLADRVTGRPGGVEKGDQLRVDGGVVGLLWELTGDASAEVEVVNEAILREQADPLEDNLGSDDSWTDSIGHNRTLRL